MYGSGMESCHGVFGRLAKTMINEDFRPTKKPIKRGDVFWTAVPNYSDNVEKERPCVVISNDRNNEFSSMINMAPLTTKPHRTDLVCNVMLHDGRMAKTNQLFVVDKKFIGDKQGKLPPIDMHAIMRSIVFQFDMAEYF